MSLTAEELTRYSQQLKLDQIGLAGQLKLKKARVLCVGAGGLGSALLFYLAAAGVGTLGIVDDDILERSNLQRQILYKETELGHKKAFLAKQNVLALNPNLKIDTYTERLTAENASFLISPYELVADCSDNFSTRYLINEVCYELNKPWCYASVQQFQGQVSFLLGGEGPCFRCLFPCCPDEEFFPPCTTGGILGVVPGLLGLIQATEILKWILGLGTSLKGQLLTVDPLNLQFRSFSFEQNPKCETCFGLYKMVNS